MYNIEKFANSMGLLPDEIKSLFETFAIELREEIALLKKAAADHDHIQISAISHNIKGISANMEMDDLFLVIKGLNDQAKQNIFTHLEEQITLIESRFTEIIKILEAYYSCTF